MRMHVTIDDNLLERAMDFGGASSVQELVHLASAEYVEKRASGNLLDLYGTGGLNEHYDYKSLRAANAKE